MLDWVKAKLEPKLSEMELNLLSLVDLKKAGLVKEHWLLLLVQL